MDEDSLADWHSCRASQGVVMLPRNMPLDAPSRVAPIGIASCHDIVARQATGTISHEIRVCRSSADFARLRSAWDMFAASCSPGLDFTYCEVAAARALGRGATVNVALVSDGGALIALWPVMIAARGAYRVARALGCGNDQEYGGPLVADPADVGHYAVALDALRHVDADVLEVPLVECDDPLAAVLSHVPRSWIRGGDTGALAWCGRLRAAFLLQIQRRGLLRPGCFSSALTARTA